MYKVLIRIGNTRKTKRVKFDNAADAEAYFNQLCQRRTDYPATVVLSDKVFTRKIFRIDKDWQGDRFIENEDIS